MFDTSTFRTKQRKPPAFTLRELGFTRPYDGAGARWFRNPPRGSHLPRINWTSSQSGDYLTVFEVSLPKFLYGNNVQTIDTDAEAMRAVDALSTIVSDITRVDCDLRDWDVARLDVCNNWKRTDAEVVARIRSLRNAHVGRMEPDPYPHGMYWKNSSETIVAYSKHADLLDAIVNREIVSDETLEAARGMFRLEHRFLRRDAIKRRVMNRFKLPDLRASSILRVGIAEAIVNEDVMALKLDKPLISSDARKERLLEKYGFTNKYFCLSTFLEDYDDPYKRVRMKREMNVETFRNYRKSLEVAGVLLDNPQPETYAPLPLMRGEAVSGYDVSSITIQPTQKILETGDWLN